MYIQWDSENSTAIGIPQNLPEETGDWYPYVDPGMRKSKAQSLTYSLLNNVVYGEWVGSDDPMDSPVSQEVIRSVWLEIMQMPVAANDGKVFQFDRNSKELMEGAIVALTASASSIDWRLKDNTTVNVDAAGLQSYYDELVLNRAIRGVTVDAEYMAFKSGGATLKQLQEWRESHSQT